MLSDKSLQNNKQFSQLIPPTILASNFTFHYSGSQRHIQFCRTGIRIFRTIFLLIVILNTTRRRRCIVATTLRTKLVHIKIFNYITAPFFGKNYFLVAIFSSIKFFSRIGNLNSDQIQGQLPRYGLTSVSKGRKI